MSYFLIHMQFNFHPCPLFPRSLGLAYQQQKGYITTGHGAHDHIPIVRGGKTFSYENILTTGVKKLELFTDIFHYNQGSMSRVKKLRLFVHIFHYDHVQCLGLKSQIALSFLTLAKVRQPRLQFCTQFWNTFVIENFQKKNWAS